MKLHSTPRLGHSNHISNCSSLKSSILLQMLYISNPYVIHIHLSSIQKDKFTSIPIYYPFMMEIIKIDGLTTSSNSKNQACKPLASTF